MVSHGEFGLEEAVLRAFPFLAEYGFVRVGADDVSVHYDADCVRLAIRHDPLSYELSLELSRNGHPDEAAHPYSMQDMIRVENPDLAERYRDFAATSVEATARGLQQLADDLRKFGERLLKCDPEAFAAVERERRKAINAFGRKVQDTSDRTRAQAAFDRQEWKQAVELYESLTDSLSPSEIKRLEIARSHSKGSGSA